MPKTRWKLEMKSNKTWDKQSKEFNKDDRKTEAQQINNCANKDWRR